LTEVHQAAVLDSNAIAIQQKPDRGIREQMYSEGNAACGADLNSLLRRPRTREANVNSKTRLASRDRSQSFDPASRMWVPKMKCKRCSIATGCPNTICAAAQRKTPGGMDHRRGPEGSTH
jgi:hypothetical protein